MPGRGSTLGQHPAAAATEAREPADTGLASADGGVGRVGRGLERMGLHDERQPPRVIPDTAASGQDLGDFLRQLRAEDGPCSSGRGFPF